MTDILIVSLGSTGGLRAADDELSGSLARAGAAVATVRARPAREWRTFAALELAWALSARRAAQEGITRHAPRALIYSTSTAALLAPRSDRPVAVRFDAPAAGNRPGRHGAWQRPVERRRFAAATLLLPWSAGALAEAPRVETPAIVLPVPVEPSGLACERDLAAVTYGANPHKKGLDRVLAAWRAARRGDEQLVVAGLDGPAEPGVTYAGTLPAPEFRALLARARVFVTAPRREDHGLAQLEALADGCVLVTTPSPGPYVALAPARALDPRAVSADLAPAIRAALDEPVPGYAQRAAALLAPLRRAATDTIVRDRLLPALE